MANARSRILWANLARCSDVSTFESSRPRIGFAPTGKTTAAATTGPASGPRPTSSIPATVTRPSPQSATSRLSDGRRCLTSPTAPLSRPPLLPPRSPLRVPMPPSGRVFRECSQLFHTPPRVLDVQTSRRLGVVFTRPEIRPPFARQPFGLRRPPCRDLVVVATQQYFRDVETAIAGRPRIAGRREQSLVVRIARR